MSFDDFPQVKWFGTSWQAPINEYAAHVPTPVGEACARCEEPIAADDRGVMIWHVGVAQAGYRPRHVECWVRETVGGIDHVLHHGLDGGCVGSCLSDPDWLTRREAAEFVARFVACIQRGKIE
jgi:hypothetical protein